jgi:hypothetical protein
MLPTQIPQQKLVLVRDMPSRPVDVQFTAGYNDYESVIPKQGVPRSPIFLFSSEWSASPMHGCLSGWYLHARRRHWLLWQRVLDDHAEPWRWDWQAVGYCQRRGVSDRTAAMYLILEFWKEQCESSGGFDALYDLIDEEGFLSVTDIEAIGREVRKHYPAP